MLNRRAILLRTFDLLYTHFAWAYDGISWVVSRGRWRSWGEAALPFLVGTRVLELGHGPGHLLATLENDGWMATGIDLSPQMGRQAKNRLTGSGFPTRLIRGRGQELPFRGEAFDSVIATFPAPYIIEPGTVRAIRRVLRPGGRMIVVPEALSTGADPFSRSMEWLFRVTGQRSPTTDKPTARPRVWETIFEPAGFAVAIHQVLQPDSVVTVIVADRIG